MAIPLKIMNPVFMFTFIEYTLMDISALGALEGGTTI